MPNAPLALTISVALAIALPVRAQDVTGFARCRAIADAGERLGCYDGLAGQARQAVVPAPGHGYQTMSLTDAKLDQDSLRGHGVEVSGNLMVVSEMALLRSGSEDTSPLAVDIKAVPREQRRTALEHCGVLGCAATVRGTLGRVMAQPGIVADSIEVR
jgi:hypothetical protein